jgi:hypothetical protein
MPWPTLANKDVDVLKKCGEIFNPTNHNYLGTLESKVRKAVQLLSMKGKEIRSPSEYYDIFKNKAMHQISPEAIKKRKV